MAIYSDAINFPIPVSVAEAGSMTLDPSEYSNAVTITGTDTIDISAGISDGQPFRLLLTGGIIGNTITWGGNIKAPNSTYSVVANKLHIFDFYFYNGKWNLPVEPTPV